MNIFTKHIARALSLPEQGVDNTLALLDEGCTIPFISRYRKERTGGLDEVQIAQIADMNDRLKELTKRKETILKTIGEQQKLTPELEKRINDCWEATQLEDIYLPYKPKRRTRAMVAREKGLEPLAQLLLMQRENAPRKAAMRFVGKEENKPSTADEALQGAKDIIAEMVAENEQSRNQVRKAFHREAFIESHVVKAKKDTDEAAKYSDYFDCEEPLRRCSSHRLLAMRRGEAEGILRVKITIDDEEATERLKRHYVKGHGPCQTLVAEAVEATAAAIYRDRVCGLEQATGGRTGHRSLRCQPPTTASWRTARTKTSDGNRPRIPHRMQGGVSRCAGEPAPS